MTRHQRAGSAKRDFAVLESVFDGECANASPSWAGHFVALTNIGMLRKLLKLREGGREPGKALRGLSIHRI